VAAKRSFQGRRVARAATEADADLVRCLAEQDPGALRAASRDGSIPLHHALRRSSLPNHSLPAVRTFLELWPESVLAGDPNGSTAVHLAVTHPTPTLEMVRLLLGEDRGRAQSLLAATDKNGSTPLHVAVARRDASKELAQYLVEQRPEAAGAKDGMGLTPLHVAALNNAPVDVIYLLARRFPDAVYEGRDTTHSRPRQRLRLE
jgi:ankyrin repeat protein